MQIVCSAGRVHVDVQVTGVVADLVGSERLLAQIGREAFNGCWSWKMTKVRCGSYVAKIVAGFKKAAITRPTHHFWSHDLL